MLAADLGGTEGAGPARVELIAVTSYQRAARFEPERRTAAEGAMGLLANTIPARERPAQVLAAVRAAADGAAVLEGVRGEAEATAALLLAALSARSTTTGTVNSDS